MAESGSTGPSNVVRLLLIAIVVSALVGGTAGYVFAPKTVTGTAPPSTYVPQTREFYLFTGTLPFNESVMGVPHDTFTMRAPFTWTNGNAWPANGINYVFHQNQELNITFVASTSGIFRYDCVSHAYITSPRCTATWPCSSREPIRSRH